MNDRQRRVVNLLIEATKDDLVVWGLTYAGAYGGAYMDKGRFIANIGEVRLYNTEGLWATSFRGCLTDNTNRVVLFNSYKLSHTIAKQHSRNVEGRVDKRYEEVMAKLEQALTNLR